MCERNELEFEHALTISELGPNMKYQIGGHWPYVSAKSIRLRRVNICQNVEIVPECVKDFSSNNFSNESY